MRLKFKGEVETLADNIASAILFHAGTLDEGVEFAAIVGTGGDAILAQPEFEVIERFPFSQFFGIGASNVEGQGGEVCVVRCQSELGIVFNGRRHMYEGKAAERSLRLMILILYALGVRYVFLTNASGFCQEGHQQGDVMVVKGFHDYFVQGGVLDGRHDGFPYVSYDGLDKGLREMALVVGQEIEGLRLSEGVLAIKRGPHLSDEFDAEILRDHHRVDAASMSIWSEAALFAAYNNKARGRKRCWPCPQQRIGLCPIRVVGFCVFTDLNGSRSSHKIHLRIGRQTAPKLAKLIDGMLERIGRGELKEEKAGKRR